MSKTIDVLLSQVRFPSTCVVCMSPASKEYRLEKTFSMGRRSYTVKVNIPMCAPHFEAASFKGPAEKLAGTLGVIGGILAGLFAAVILMLRWQGTGADNIILKLFAEAESKEARNAVRITHYWPSNQVARLEFENEPLAEIVERTSFWRNDLF